MLNIPKMKVGIVAVSRDCFPESLSVNRRKALVEAYEKKYGKGDIYECPVCIVESEIQMQQALADVMKAGCNALCVYLGNFGPEISETMLAKEFSEKVGGPVMFCAAAEENIAVLADSRGDAYCGMLNASYNLKLRGVKAYIPEYPVGDAEECADMIHDFLPVARAVYALKHLKIISFGPRPTNFLACNAPIQQLYNLGVEIEENSELDLFEAFHKHDRGQAHSRSGRGYGKELGEGNKKPEILAKLAQYELTLLDWIEAHKGSREYVAVAGKCWPAFQTQFGFVPCYVNSPTDGARDSRLVRGGYLRRAFGVHRHGGLRGRGHAARHQQHGAQGALQRGHRRQIQLQADGYVYGLPLREHLRGKAVQPHDEVSEDHGAVSALWR